MIDRYEFEALPVTIDGVDGYRIRYRLPGDDGMHAWSFIRNDEGGVVFVSSVGQAKHVARQWDDKRIRRSQWAEQAPIKIWTTETL